MSLSIKMYLISLNLDPLMLIFLIFCVSDDMHKALLLHIDMQVLSQKKHLCNYLSCELS